MNKNPNTLNSSEKIEISSLQNLSFWNVLSIFLPPTFKNQFLTILNINP